jgi:hypothetical protein
MRQWPKITLSVLAVCMTAVAKPKPPKMVVQLYAQQIVAADLEIIQVYLVLPDGSRAEAICSFQTDGCMLDPFTPEKRESGNCLPPDKSFQATCYANEMYYADRKANDITLYGAKGGVTYHITGSWTEFVAGTLPKRLIPPRWTAACRDGTLSYSQDRSGTCSDHGGVYAWANP